MAKITKEEFVEKYDEYIERIAEVDKNNFNVFYVLGLQNYEIRHSDFLVWLLSNPVFLDRFVEKCGFEISGINEGPAPEIIAEDPFEEVDEHNRKIQKESFEKNTLYWLEGENTPFLRNEYKEDDQDERPYIPLSHDTDLYKNYMDLTSKKKSNKSPIRRRIDINIIGNNYTITIENKVDSLQHDNQCIAYKNYMDSSDKYNQVPCKHYYVFLAKKIPDNWATPIYRDYIFFSYEMIKDILNDMATEAIETWAKEPICSVINNYIETINEWYSFPERYKSILKDKEFDIEPFADENINATRGLMDKLSVSQKQFVDIARRYYEDLKDRYDKEIKEVLQGLCADKDFIKEDYARGNYAKTIPVLFEDVGVEKYISKYCKKTGLNKDALYKLYKKSLEKNNGIDEKGKERLKLLIKDRDVSELENYGLKKLFKTVDYRAPRGKYSNPNIAIVSGLTTPYSINLLDELNKRDSVINAIKNLDKWDVNFAYSIRNGTGYGPIKLKSGGAPEIQCDLNRLYLLAEKDRERIFKTSQSFVGQMKMKSTFEKNYFDYLSVLKGMLFSEDQIRHFCLSLLEYYTDDIRQNEIKTSLKNIQILVDNCPDCKTWIDEKMKEIVFDWDLISELSAQIISDETKKAIISGCKMDLFKDWLDKAVPKLKSKADIEKIKNGYIKEWVYRFLGDESIPKDKTVLSIIAPNYDKRTHKQTTIVWNLTIIYEFSDDEYQNSREKSFFEKTREGVSVFGYEKWFEDHIWNKK